MSRALTEMSRVGFSVITIPSTQGDSGTTAGPVPGRHSVPPLQTFDSILDPCATDKFAVRHEKTQQQILRRRHADAGRISRNRRSLVADLPDPKSAAAIQIPSVQIPADLKCLTQPSRTATQVTTTIGPASSLHQWNPLERFNSPDQNR
jgi:hypothetical protein